MKQTHGYLVLRRLAILLPLIAWVLPARGGKLYDLVSGLDPAQPTPAGGGGDPGAPMMSADGRFVLFEKANRILSEELSPPGLDGVRFSSSQAERTGQTGHRCPAKERKDFAGQVDCGEGANWYGRRGKVRDPPLGPWTTPTQTRVPETNSTDCGPLLGVFAVTDNVNPVGLKTGDSSWTIAHVCQR